MLRKRKLRSMESKERNDSALNTTPISKTYRNTRRTLNTNKKYSFISNKKVNSTQYSHSNYTTIRGVRTKEELLKDIAPSNCEVTQASHKLDSASQFMLDEKISDSIRISGAHTPSFGNVNSQKSEISSILQEYDTQDDNILSQKHSNQNIQNENKNIVPNYEKEANEFYSTQFTEYQSPLTFEKPPSTTTFNTIDEEEHPQVMTEAITSNHFSGKDPQHIIDQIPSPHDSQLINFTIPQKLENTIFEHIQTNDEPKLNPEISFEEKSDADECDYKDHYSIFNELAHNLNEKLSLSQSEQKTAQDRIQPIADKIEMSHNTMLVDLTDFKDQPQVPNDNLKDKTEVISEVISLKLERFVETDLQNIEHEILNLDNPKVASVVESSNESNRLPQNKDSTKFSNTPLLRHEPIYSQSSPNINEFEEIQHKRINSDDIVYNSKENPSPKIRISQNEIRQPRYINAHQFQDNSGPYPSNQSYHYQNFRPFNCMPPQAFPQPNPYNMQHYIPNAQMNPYYNPYSLYQNNYAAAAFVKWQQEYARWYQMYTANESRSVSRRDSQVGSVDCRLHSETFDIESIPRVTSTKNQSFSYETNDELFRRSSPLNFTVSHSCGKFMNGNILAKIDCNKIIFTKFTSPTFEKFPFPDVSETSHSTSRLLLKYITQTVDLPNYMDDLTRLTWKIFFSIIQKNGDPDIFDLSEKIFDYNDSLVDGYLASQLPDNSAIVRTKIMKDILNNELFESLNTAIISHNWGLGFALAYNSTQASEYVYKKFIESLDSRDLIKSYLSVHSGTTLNVSAISNADLFQRWNQYIAILLNESIENREKCISDIESISNVLKSKSKLSEYRVCKLILDLVFEQQSNESPFSDLIESFDYFPETLVNFRTCELYEYAKRLKSSDYLCPRFQKVKYQYAEHLFFYHEHTKSFTYCKSIATKIKPNTTVHYFYGFLYKLNDLSINLHRILNLNVDYPKWLNDVSTMLNDYFANSTASKQRFSESTRGTSSLDLSSKTKEISPILSSKLELIKNIPSIDVSSITSQPHSSIKREAHSLESKASLQSNKVDNPVPHTELTEPEFIVPLLSVSPNENKSQIPIISLPPQRMSMPRPTRPPVPRNLHHATSLPSSDPAQPEQPSMNKMNSEPKLSIEKANSADNSCRDAKPHSPGILSSATKMLSGLFKSKEEIYLPDDSNPLYVFDPIKKRYVQKDGKDESNEANQDNGPPRSLPPSQDPLQPPSTHIYRLPSSRYVPHNY